MPVVSNTSPILNLAIIDRLILLQQQFGEILIPNGVLDELKINEEQPGSQAIREAISAGWIQSREVANEPLTQLLKQTLDKGESEAIALNMRFEHLMKISAIVLYSLLHFSLKSENLLNHYLIKSKILFNPGN